MFNVVTACSALIEGINSIHMFIVVIDVSWCLICLSTGRQIPIHRRIHCISLVSGKEVHEGAIHEADNMKLAIRSVP